LVCLCVQTGTLGEVNTTERLKATRWLWQDVPQADHPGWMVRGRDGKNFVTYGLGQSLVMLPADLVAGRVERFIGPPRLKEKLREFVVAILTFPALCATAALMAYLVLSEAGFGRAARVGGALGLQLASSFLHYSQDHEENSLMVLLGLVLMHAALRWWNTGRTAVLWPAAAAVGFGFLIRQPFLAVPAGVALAMFGIQCYRRKGLEEFSLDVGRLSSGGDEATPAEGSGPTSVPWAPVENTASPMPAPATTLLCGKSPPPRNGWIAMLMLAAGALVGFGVERIYHHHRFARWTGTYFSIASEQARHDNPALPEGWMLMGNFWEGFWGPLVTPQRSLVMFDPLLLLLPLALWASQDRLRRRSGWLLAGLFCAFMAQVIFYARYIAWEGAAAWANRHTLLPVHLAVVLIAALTVEGWRRMPSWGRTLSALLVAYSLAVQLASVVYPDALEGYAVGVIHKPGGIHFERPVWVVGQRFEFIWDGIRGRELANPDGRMFHRVCLAPAVATREFPRLAWVAWGGWLMVVGMTAAAASRLCKATVAGRAFYNHDATDAT
jgi:hypothetical protein